MSVEEEVSIIAEPAFRHQVRTVGPRNQVFEPVGMCIYCRGTMLSSRKLGLEHIIPDGLGGDLKLPSASCDACERTVNKFEQSVQKTTFGVVRDFFDLRSSKKRKAGYVSRQKYHGALRISPFALKIGPQPKVANLAPVLMNFEVFPYLPEIMQDEPTPSPDTSFAHVTNPFASFDPLRKLDKLSISTTYGDWHRFLAKVATSYAVSCLGVERFKPYLNDMILGRSFDSERCLFGGEKGAFDVEVLHEMSLALMPPRQPIAGYDYPHGAGQLVLVGIQLFKALCDRKHWIVAGEYS